MLKAWGLAMAISGCVLAGCAAFEDPRYNLPPPLALQALPSAQGTIYDPSGMSPPNNPSSYCITSSGYCSLTAPVETGLSCTCDSNHPKFGYGGKTGAIPAMPAWADPRLPPE